MNMPWNQGKVVKAKVKKVTARELQANIRKIQDAMTNVMEKIDSYEKLSRELECDLKKAYPNTDEYAKLSRELEYAQLMVSQNRDTYERLSKELEHEYVILRKYKDSKFYIEPKQYLLIAGGIIVTTFFVCLEREVPSVVKFCNLLFKIMPFRG